MHPLTHTRPKAMLQVAGKPLVYHVLSNLKKAGIASAVVIVKYEKELIEEYLKENSPIPVEFAVQGEKQGTGAALLAAKEKMNEDFLATAGDIIADPEIYKKVLEEHKGGKTVALKEVSDPSRYGVAEVHDGVITGFEEKSESPKSNLANTSVYCFNPSIFNELEATGPSPRGEYELPSVFKGAKAVPTEKFWMDVGYPWHLFDLNDYLLSSMESSVERVENSTINGKLIMEKGAVVFDSYVEGMAYISADSKIGPHAFLRGNNSVGRGCEIGESTTLKNSILFDRVKAKHLAYIGDSVIGEGVNFGAGMQVANFRFDEQYINVLTDKGWVNSGRKKLGAIVGDGAKFGVLSCTMPGKLIGKECWIGSGVVVTRNLASSTRLFQRHDYITRGE